MSDKSMNVVGWVGNSCSTGPIAGLGTMPDAYHAMLKFCCIELARRNYYEGYDQTNFRPTHTFYTFSAGPEEPGHGESKTWVKYGTEFAQFILDNKLGDVATLGPHKNVRYHPNTTCQLWIWRPDRAALIEWFKPLISKIPKTLPGRPANPGGEEICPACSEAKRYHTGWTCPSGKVWPEEVPF